MKRIILLIALFAVAPWHMAAQDTVKSHTITIGNSELGSFHENLFPKKAPSRWSVGLQLGMADNHYDVDVQYADKVQFRTPKASP